MAKDQKVQKEKGSVRVNNETLFQIGELKQKYKVVSFFSLNFVFFLSGRWSTNFTEREPRTQRHQGNDE